MITTNSSIFTKGFVSYKWNIILHRILSAITHNLNNTSIPPLNNNENPSLLNVRKKITNLKL